MDKIKKQSGPEYPTSCQRAVLAPAPGARCDFHQSARLATANLRRESGSSTILLLAMMPFLLAAIFFAPVLMSHLHLVAGSLSICRTHLLEFEERQAKQLEKLEQLNLIVKAQRAEELALRVALVAAIASLNPIAISEIQLQLEALEQQKALVLGQQNLLLAANRALAFQAQHKVQMDLRRHIESYRLLLRRFLDTQLVRLNAGVGPLAVEPDKSGLQPPIYELEQPFTARQAAYGTWTFATSSQRTWLGNWLSVNKTWQGQCSVSLEKKGSSWTAKILKK